MSGTIDSETPCSLPATMVGAGPRGWPALGDEGHRNFSERACRGTRQAGEHYPASRRKEPRAASHQGGPKMNVVGLLVSCAAVVSLWIGAIPRVRWYRPGIPLARGHRGVLVRGAAGRPAVRRRVRHVRAALAGRRGAAAGHGAVRGRRHGAGGRAAGRRLAGRRRARDRGRPRSRHAPSFPRSRTATSWPSRCSSSAGSPCSARISGVRARGLACSCSAWCTRWWTPRCWACCCPP